MNEIQQLNQRIEYLERVINTLVLSDRFRIHKLMGFDDGRNIQFGRTTGTMIGTAADQKLSFFGVDPVIQQSAITAPSGGSVADAIDSSARSKINDIRTVLTNVGLTA